MKKTAIILIVILFTSGLYSQIINREPLSQRITGYHIDAKLDPHEKTVTGYMEAFWVNMTNETVPDIQLHMYMNAFRSNKTTFSREGRGSVWSKSSNDGWIDINTCVDSKGTDLIPFMQYISPDDDNIYDSTVLKIILPIAAKPGDSVLLKVNFITKLPSNIIRTGYSGDFFFVAQWFPKFGVYEPAGMRYRQNGGWNCHQFHSNSEFYSNHSVYAVKISLPKEYVVGSCGMLMDEVDDDTAGISKTLTYRAEDIVDFAWTAWTGYKVFTDQWEHVKITLLIPGKRINMVERQFDAVKNALEFFSKNVGQYPWPHLTFISPPQKGMGSGGMEYTTMFTTDASDKVPEWIRVPETTTVHEFGHAYFMGIMASNEFEEPWMDEGINSFFEGRIMDHYWGGNSGFIDHPLLKVPHKFYSRSVYVLSPDRQVVSNNEYAWNYPSDTYGMMSYNKSATCLYTLMGIVGEETTNEIFREYYRKWAFKHPSGKDFINVVNEVVKKMHGDKFGPDMNWFFDQTLYGTGICDYKVAGFTNKKYEDSDSLYDSVVRLQRLGEVMLPVDVKVHFTNGDEVLETWDGISRYKEFNYTGYKKVEWVKIDPDSKIRMDVNLINNSSTDNPDRVPIRRFTNKFISLMQILISAFTL